MTTNNYPCMHAGVVACCWKLRSPSSDHGPELTSSLVLYFPSPPNNLPRKPRPTHHSFYPHYPYSIFPASMYGDWDSNLPSAGRVPILLGLGFSLHSVTLMFVFANILVKRKRGKLGVDDALICVASVRYMFPTPWASLDTYGEIDVCACCCSCHRCRYV